MHHRMDGAARAAEGGGMTAELRERILRLLREIEYSDGGWNCPQCEAYEQEPHAPHCELAAVIRELEAPDPGRWEVVEKSRPFEGLRISDHELVPCSHHLTRTARDRDGAAAMLCLSCGAWLEARGEGR